MVKAPRAANSHRDLGKLLRTGMLALALVLQGYLSQVHHHDFAASTLAVAVGGDTTSAPPVPPVDSDGRDHHCFICHLSGLGSVSVLPPIVLTIAPVGLVVYRVTHDPIDSRAAASAYSSRAPPSLFVQT